MDEFESVYDGLTGSGRYNFPEPTRGLSSYGRRSIAASQFAPQQPVKNDLALQTELLKLAQQEFSAMSQMRSMQIALQQQQDKNRIAAQGIEAIKASQALNPESDDYLSQKSKLLDAYPYAAYDPAFNNTIGFFDNRNSKFIERNQQLVDNKVRRSQQLADDEIRRNQQLEDNKVRRSQQLADDEIRLKNAQDKIKHAEAYTAYKTLVNSLSGTELYEYGQDILNLSPDSSFDQIMQASATIKQGRAERDFDRDLARFGYNPSDFGTDLSKKARTLGKVKADYEDTIKQLEISRNLFKDFAKAADDPETGVEAAAQMQIQGRNIVDLSKRLEELRAKKDADGNPIRQANAAPTSKQISLQIIDAIEKAKIGEKILISGQQVEVTQKMKNNIVEEKVRLLATPDAAKPPVTSAIPGI